MAYTPTLSDIEEIRSQGYSPSLSDIDEIRKKPLSNLSLSNVMKSASAKAALSPRVAFDAARQSFANPIANVGNVISAGINKIVPGAHIAPREPQYLTPQESARDPKAALVGNIAANLATFLGGGEALEGARLGAEALPYLGKAAAYLGKEGLPSTLKRAIGAGIFGAVEDPDHPLKSAAQAALESPLFELAPAAAIKGGKTLLNSLKNTSSNTLAKSRAINAAQPEGLSLFDIAGNQAGQRFMNEYLGKIPFSGVKSSIKQSVSNVEDKIKSLMNSFRGKQDPSTIDDRIRDEVINNFTKNKELDKQNFKNVDTMANQANIKIENRPELQKVANDYIQNHNNAIKSGNTSGLTNDAIENLKLINNPSYNPKNLIGDVDSSIVSQESDIGQALKNKGIAQQATSKKIIPSNLNAALHSRSTFGDLSQEHYAKGNNYVGKMYSDLKEATNKDINDVISKSENPNIKDEWANALKYHKNNIVPYSKNGFITRVFNNNIQPENLSGQLLTGNKEKILADLSPEARRALAFKHFSKAGKEVGSDEAEWSAAKLMNRYDQLSPRQQKVLFTPKERDQIASLRRQVEANAENVLAMKKPATGYALAGQSVLPALGLAALGLTAVNPEEHPILNTIGKDLTQPALWAILGGSSVGARALNKLLRSKALKEAYLRGQTATRINPSLAGKAILSQQFGTKNP